MKTPRRGRRAGIYISKLPAGDAGGGEARDTSTGAANGGPGGIRVFRRHFAKAGGDYGLDSLPSGASGASGASIEPTGQSGTGKRRPRVLDGVCVGFERSSA